MGLNSHCHLLLLPFIAYILFFFNSASLADQPPYACDQSDPSTSSYAFCKANLPISQRVDDLVTRLTLDEKIAQLVDQAPAIPRLGIPRYDWWSESLHGVASVGRGIHFGGPILSATSFPQVIHTAATFNETLWYRVGEAISTEARAIYNNGHATGLTFWAPNINIFRDPRWGRGQETPGEDPIMVGKYAAAFVRGIQGDASDGSGSSVGPVHLKASACCKHFTAYDMDSWKGITRYMFDAKVTAQDSADTYQPPFRKCVENGRASGIMCSYNSVNAIPTCADSVLLSKTARGDWGFNGYIVSDCNAVNVITSGHHYTKTDEDAVAAVLKAGMDVECGSKLLQKAKSSLQQGKLAATDIDRALRNLFSIRMRLGLFNGHPKDLPYGDISLSQICTQEHQNLALEAAREGVVLLKNAFNLLPLSTSKTRTLAVIGPNANNQDSLLANYHGPPCKLITPLQGLQRYVSDVRYLAGCDTTACNSSVLIDKAVEVAKLADDVVLVMGLNMSLEEEMIDRMDLLLPGEQQNLVSSVAKAAKKPVVLVLLSGGSLDVTFAKRDSKIGSILWAGYPGEAGGLAIADVIFGTHNPGGRLPVTWYPQDYTRIPMTDMRMRPDKNGYPGRTYRFYRGPQVFKFGYGLSYSTYTYEFVSVPRQQISLNKFSHLQSTKNLSSALYDTSLMGEELCDSLKFSTVIGVKNQGTMAGRHPVLLFIRGSTGRDDAPIKELVGFKSVHLLAGERLEVEFEVRPCEHLSRTEEDGSRVMEAGSHFLTIGNVKTQLKVVG